MKVINTDQCEKECEYCEIEEKDKANIFINCTLKDKTYRYGQYIDCEDGKKKGEL